MNHYHWLTLAYAYVGVGELIALLDRFGDTETIVRQPEAELCAAGLSQKKSRAITTPDHKALQCAERWLQGDRHEIIAYGCDGYPDLLTQLSDAPLLLFVNGDIDALHLPSLAIVGSRNPTRGGIQNSVDFSRHLAASGYVIVSGMAEGIDAAAHRGAIEAGGQTVAFLGHGIDRVYPPKNHELAHQISISGALLSEYPIGTAPNKRHFPERNRLISGLSLGTLVIEAARKSGSLITARLAAEQGREVFALPGSIHNPLARGCHQLIRQGAKLVETANDINAELAPIIGHLRQTTMKSTSRECAVPKDDAAYASLRQALGHDPASVDELHHRSGLTIAELSSMLLILELRGEVESLSGGHYALIA